MALCSGCRGYNVVSSVANKLCIIWRAVWRKPPYYISAFNSLHLGQSFISCWNIHEKICWDWIEWGWWGGERWGGVKITKPSLRSSRRTTPPPSPHSPEFFGFRDTCVYCMTLANQQPQTQHKHKCSDQLQPFNPQTSSFMIALNF